MKLTQEKSLALYTSLNGRYVGGSLIYTQNFTKLSIQELKNSRHCIPQQSTVGLLLTQQWRSLRAFYMTIIICSGLRNVRELFMSQWVNQLARCSSRRIFNQIKGWRGEVFESQTKEFHLATKIFLPRASLTVIVDRKKSSRLYYSFREKGKINIKSGFGNSCGNEACGALR